MNKYTYIFAFIFLLHTGVSEAQNKKANTKYKKGFSEAVDLIFQEKYAKALPLLLHLDSMQDNANLRFYIGYCYLMSPLEKNKSIAYLEYAAQHTTADYTEGDYKQQDAPPYTAISLGDAYHMNYLFDKAIATYEGYKAILHESQKKEIEDIDRKLEISKNAQALVNKPVPMTTSNLGPLVNSVAPDYSPVITADESEIIFTSRRAGSTGGLIDEDGYAFEDIYISENVNGTWDELQKIDSTINSNGHEAPTGLSADGQMLLIYKFTAEDGGDIYLSNRMGDTWTEPKRFGEGINTTAWESHATISADGQFLSFTSDREGGIGGRDIYFCKRLPTGDWAMPQNYGPAINTIYDEGSPFLHPDGKTLFFSSKGHNTMGGFDIFYTVKQDDGSWSEPVNLGYPVNTTGDDVYYMPTTDGKSAYYASFRQDGMGEKDIYKITLPHMEEKKLTVYRGTIKNRKGEVPEDIYIEVSDNETGELVGTYTPNSATGEVPLHPSSRAGTTISRMKVSWNVTIIRRILLCRKKHHTM